jgi:hypothetical protein
MNNNNVLRFPRKPTKRQTHGTHEQWETGCDCEDCCSAMRDLIRDSDLPRSRWTLSHILAFRTSGCEFHFTPLMVSIEVGMCRNTVRRHIDELVSLGALSKVGVASNESGRSGTYLLHVEKLHIREELLRYRESHGIPSRF